MHREPSIHITKSSMIEIYRSMGFGFYESVSMADELFHYARPHSIHTRTVTVSTERMEKKAERLVKSSRRDADLLAQLIYATRKRMKHRGISQIKVGSKDWGVLKEITAHALDFSNEFNLQRRYGFLKYVEISLAKMKKFNLNKFLPMYQGVCETYQGVIEIEEDKDKEMTDEMYVIYSQRVIERTGIRDETIELPEKYVWFIRAREQAESMNVAVNIYMLAQFDGLDFAGGIPHPTQLVGPKATERVIRYCSKEGIKIKGHETRSD